MSELLAGGIDCDLHPAVPNIAVLLPYLEPHWREMAVTCGKRSLWPIYEAAMRHNLPVGQHAGSARRVDKRPA